MKFLFIHQSFPAQYWRLVAWLRDQGHDITFITGPTSNAMLKVRKVEYQFDGRFNPQTFAAAQEFEVALRRAETVARIAGDLKRSGYQPEIIIGHHGWGELLNVQDVWPEVPLLGYHEYYYRGTGSEVDFDPEFGTPPEGRAARVRAKNAINHLALTDPGQGQTPTRFQLSTYPAEFRHKIKLIEEGVDLDALAPDPAAARTPLSLAGMSLDPTTQSAFQGITILPSQKLVTFVCRTLEPVRGFHVMMRALPQLLRREDIHVAIVGRDADGYGPKLEDKTWKEYFLEELHGQYDADRVHFLNLVDYQSYLRLLQRSDAHVYLTYPFVLSWSLREALASGCAVVASDTVPVQEFVIDGHNGLMTPFFDHARLADTILRLLEDNHLNARLRAAARNDAMDRFSLDNMLSVYRRTIESLTGATLLPTRALEEQRGFSNHRLPAAASLTRPAGCRL